MEIATSQGVRFLQHDQPLASYSTDEIRAVANQIYETTENLGCVIFPAADDKRNVLIVFAGNLEKFQMLSVARYARCKVVYFQDPVSFWYQGSQVLPDLLSMESFIRENSAGLRPLFFGQSSGGYASLIMAGLVGNSFAIACSPQTGPDATLKAQLTFGPGINPQFAPNDLVDVGKFLKERPNRSQSAVFASASEHENPISSHMWCDWLHLSRLVSIDGIKLHVTAIHRHSIIFRNAEKFSRLIESSLAAEGLDAFDAACMECLRAVGSAGPEGVWL